MTNAVFEPSCLTVAGLLIAIIVMSVVALVVGGLFGYLHAIIADDNYIRGRDNENDRN